MVDEPSEQRIDLDRSLYRTPPDQYGEEYQDHLLEQYKLYVQMADTHNRFHHGGRCMLGSFSCSTVLCLLSTIPSCMEADADESVVNPT